MTTKPESYPDDLSTRVEREWQAYDEYYSERTLHQPYFYNRARREGAFLGALIARFGIPRGAAIADFGCGNGLHSQLFHERGMRVTGIDRSPKAIEYCKAKYGDSCQWLCDDAFDAQRSEEFDCGFCFWFMYFNAFDIPKDGTHASHALMRQLKPGGTLFFLWHSDLTAIRLPAERFSVMNFTIPQLRAFFPDYRTEGYAIDSPAMTSRILGRYSFNKYVTRLSCARVYMQASNWKRARLLLVVRK